MTLTAEQVEPIDVDRDNARTRRGPRYLELVALVLGLCVLSATLGWWLAQPRKESFSAVDTGFLRDMTVHHSSAIQLGFAYLGVENDPSVGHFAREIIQSQSQEIAAMNGVLADAGNVAGASDGFAMEWMGMRMPAASMPGIPTDEEMARLKASRGMEADDLFSELMIRHHAAGASMAEYAAQNGQNDRVRTAASGMAAAQRSEIIEINQRRAQLGLDAIDTPAGAFGH